MPVSSQQPQREHAVYLPERTLGRGWESPAQMQGLCVDAWSHCSCHNVASVGNDVRDAHKAAVMQKCCAGMDDLKTYYCYSRLDGQHMNHIIGEESTLLAAVEEGGGHMLATLNMHTYKQRQICAWLDGTQVLYVNRMWWSKVIVATLTSQQWIHLHM